MILEYKIKCYKNLALFEMTNASDLVENWLCILQEKYNCVVHSHTMHSNILMVRFEMPKKAPVKKILSNGKRFMAYEIIDRLELSNENDILEILKEGLSRSEIKKGQLHRVFEKS